MRACAVFASVIFSWAALPAQPSLVSAREQINFEHFALEQGLSQNTIQCILQDKRGFIWLGTQDGLNKYDGYGFTVYAHDPQNPQSLSDNWIDALYEDSMGILWIGTRRGGLNRFEPVAETFKSYTNDPQDSLSLSDNFVLSICESRQTLPSLQGMRRDEALWIGTTSGLNKFDRETEKFGRYQYDPANPKTVSHNWVASIYEDRAGVLWIGTERGLKQFDHTTKSIRAYQVASQNSSTVDDKWVTSILEDRAGSLWIATNTGFYRLDPAANAIKQYKHDPKNPHSLSNDNIRCLFADHAGTLWLGTRGGGLDRFDPATETFLHYRHDPKNSQSLSVDDVFSIHEDRSGGIWVGTRAGLDRFERAPSPFHHYQHDPENSGSLSDNAVWSIYEDRSASVWIGTLSGGLDQFDRATETFKHYRNEAGNPYSLSNNSVWSIYEDRAGTLWVGTRDGGLNKFDRAQKTFRHFQHDPNNPNSLSHNWVTSIHEDAASPEVLWIGTWGGGLNRFDRAAGSFKSYKHDPKAPQSLSAVGVWLIHEAAAESGRFLWIGTEAGLDRFDRATESFRHFQHDPNDPHSLSNNSVWSIYESGEAMWIGTNSGLNRFDRKTETIRQYRKKDGLPNEVIYGILGDERGNLWLSTNKGIVKFNPETGTIKSYEARDGLQSNEFNANAAFQNRRGEMFFGGINGFNVFHPDSVKDNSYIPPVAITALRRYNTDVAEGIAIAEKGVSARDEIVLSYKDEILTFEFAALSYRNTFKNQYAFKLEGFNENWIQLGTERRATFTNLSPGAYTLRVKGANNDGVWNEVGAALKVMITPPWWMAKWAYALYAALCLGLLYAIRRFELNRREQKTMLTESELRALAAEAQAQALQAENARQELELQKATELESAYQALAESHAHLKATQQQLVTQAKLASLGQLTAGIAHEIKNPLNFVNNFAVLSVDLVKELREEIERRRVKSEGREDFANIEEILDTLEQNAAKINHHGKRADGIVKSMMQHARGSSGQRELADINHLLDEAVNLVYHGMRANDASFNVTIEKEYDESIGKLNVVPQDISRVFLNIMNNAAYAAHQKKKANRDGFSPTLSVATKNLGDQIEIRIRDNGNGIPAAVRDKIFNPFFTTKPTGQGTGLGLSISYDIIVQEHKGEIKFDSEEGRFTEFVIYLPKAVT